MNQKKLIFGVLFFFPFSSQSGDLLSGNAEHRNISWQPVFENKYSESSEETFKSLAFKGASFDEDFLPVYVESAQLSGNYNNARAEISNVQTAPLLEKELIRNEKKIGSDFLVTTTIAYRKKIPYASISILPIRKSGSGGYERLVSFDLKLIPMQGAPQRVAARIYNHNSVLANGSWYRIAIVQNGVYKITYHQLKTLGMNPDSLDPRNIHLYGNGGGMLPFANYKPRYDDLQENAIKVIGENDGRFDQGDYILFYGTEQTAWNYNTTTSRFTHQVNNYADTTYYFLTSDQTNGKRMQSRASSTAAPTNVVTSFDDYSYHELDQVNLLKSGREWYGEIMDNFNNTFRFPTFSFPNISVTDTVFVAGNFLGRATHSNFHSDNTFTFLANGQSILSRTFNDVGETPQDNYGSSVQMNAGFFSSSPDINITLQITSSDPNILAYVNYIELNARRDLSNSGSQVLFRDSRSVGAGKVSEFRISNATSRYSILDVTDPVNVTVQESTLASGEIRFTTPTDVQHTFMSFDTLQPNTVTLVGKVENQNLHSFPQARMLIVTNPLFIAQATQLADFHRTHDHISVNVATTQQIFNEFSSGAQDVSAIRDFIKMFYDRSSSTADMPRYLLLMGDASFDNKYRISPNTNFVTSYESAGSLNQTQTYMSDDFFGLLDDSEGEWTNSEIVDISVGRLPVKSVTEAEGAVQKIIHYSNGSLTATTVSGSVFNDWRNVVSFVADDQDNNTHFVQADSLAKYFAATYPVYNVDKIYMDAYNQETTPGGQRYPDGHKAIVDRVQRGSLLMTYIGHGGELGWGHERFLEVSDINNWSNFNNLPAFLTATCEFTRVDDPGRTSAGELVFLNPNGGGICLFTTSRLAFSSSNFNLCEHFFTHVMNPVNGNLPTIGDLFEQTKIDVFTDQYVRNFLLIGDPAVQMAYPKSKIQTNTVNGVIISNPIDTLKSLSRITITGQIQNDNGQKLSQFNGILYPTVYDKPVIYSTLGNDISVTTDPSYPAPFTLQKNVIFKGKVSVVNGDFSFTFVVPKDIQFQYGFGKLSYYAQNGESDAAGYYSNVVVGGFNSASLPDGHGPEVNLYMNDEKFTHGGMTDKNPILYAIVKDSSGINTVGTGIGHDMTAVLDKDEKKLVVLNDYYENELNSFQKGSVKYQFKDLEAGPHTLTFKVWDVYNNSSEATTDFVVSESASLALEHVLNYPNPFTTHTTFMFEHNRPYVELDVQVQIFTVSGKLIKSLSSKITTEGFRFDNLAWDGLDDYGDRIGKGVYIYKVRVKSADGSSAEKFEKLVILR